MGLIFSWVHKSDSLLILKYLSRNSRLGEKQVKKNAAELRLQLPEASLQYARTRLIFSG